MSLENRNHPFLDKSKEVNPTGPTKPDGSFNRLLGAMHESSRIDSINRQHQSLEEIMQALNARDANVKQLQGPLRHGSSGEPAGVESNEQAADPQGQRYYGSEDEEEDQNHRN